VKLFSEEIIESGAWIQNASDNGAAGVVGLSFDGSPRDEEIAGISHVLFCDAFRDRLRALKLSARVKVTTILAGSKVRPTFRTSALQADLDRGRDDGPAHCAPQNLLKTRHMHRARALPLLPFWGTGLRLSRASYTLAAVVLVSTLSVFSFGHLWLTTSVVWGRLQGL
jgi:hypothetical protein